MWTSVNEKERSSHCSTCAYSSNIRVCPSFPKPYPSPHPLTPVTGSTKDEEAVSGTITIPEVAHDTEADEYVFDIEIYSDASSKQPVKDLVRAQLVPQLRTKLSALAPTLVSAHAKDLQHANGHAPAFKPATVYQSSSVNKPASPSPSSSATTTTTSVNVTTVTDTDEFRCPATELYTTFTDPARLAAFTRAPPAHWSGAHPGARFELFGGNVQAEFVALEAPTRIVQKWRLTQWPAGHYSRLELRFDQNDVDAVTAMRVQWTGVPVGQEDVTKRNWREYYVGSIKRTFGFGTVL